MVQELDATQVQPLPPLTCLRSVVLVLVLVLVAMAAVQQLLLVLVVVAVAVVQLLSPLPHLRSVLVVVVLLLLLLLEAAQLLNHVARGAPRGSHAALKRRRNPVHSTCVLSLWCHASRLMRVTCLTLLGPGGAAISNGIALIHPAQRAPLLE